jgi:hypothetical protein
MNFSREHRAAPPPHTHTHSHAPTAECFVAASSLPSQVLSYPVVHCALLLVDVEGSGDAVVVAGPDSSE